ncbi:MAG: redox-sensing transcriptional repressor Rex [Treponemataceae bacterium]|nr:redox-sensing transcriptional repressor Rex [Treponemataceae bacterium]
MGVELQISKPTRERLIRLVRLLDQLEKAGKTTVSSAEIQQRTGWTSFTVRRDVSSLGIHCSSPAGYKTTVLKDEIRRKLDLGIEEKLCCIVGLGKLGAALAAYGGFANSTFKIVAGFDTSVNRTETLIAPFPLYTTTRMESVIKNLGIEYAILTVPEASAQEMALRLAACGLRGIVNYTTAILRVPETTAVENLSVIDALQKLSTR